MVPPAPVTFSTMTGWPSELFIRSANTRPIVSVTPPTANGTTIMMGRDGYVCALAMRGRDGSAAAPAARCRKARRASVIFAPSLRLDVGRPDHLAPLLGFVGHELAEVGGRARKHRPAQ